MNVALGLLAQFARGKWKVLYRSRSRWRQLLHAAEWRSGLRSDLMRASFLLRDERLERLLTQIVIDSAKPWAVPSSGDGVRTLGVSDDCRHDRPSGLRPDSIINVGLVDHPMMDEGAERVDSGVAKRVLAVFGSVRPNRQTKRLA